MDPRCHTYIWKRFTGEAEPPEPANPRHSGDEVGGRRFRIGFSDAGIPYRYRKKRRNKKLALLGVGALAFSATGYGLATITQVDGIPATASACTAANPHGTLAAQAAPAGGHGPGIFQLNVFNATERESLAAETAAQLRQRGFTIDLVSNDPLNSHLPATAEVRGSKWYPNELHDVAAQVPGARIQIDARSDPSVDLVLGSAFTGLSKVRQANCAP